GLGRVMVETVAKDLLRRGFKAIEAFGDARWKEPACVLPADHLLAVGFKTVRQHHAHPRLRLELRSTLSWKEDVEMALDRLLGAVQKEPALRPLGSTPTNGPTREGRPIRVSRETCTAVEAALHVLLGDEVLKVADDRGLRLGTDDSLGDLPTLVDVQGRDGHDAVLGGRARVLVDVELDDL